MSNPILTEKLQSLANLRAGLQDIRKLLGEAYVLCPSPGLLPSPVEDKVVAKVLLNDFYIGKVAASGPLRNRIEKEINSRMPEILNDVVASMEEEVRGFSLAIASELVAENSKCPPEG